MLDFHASIGIFYTLMAFSIGLTLLLLISYQRQHQNLLLRSCCVVLLVMYGIILAGHIVHGGHAYERGAFCETQAFILNYIYICIHAHACFMMINNCYIALGWKVHIFEGSRFREGMFTLFSYAVPTVFIVIFSFMAATSTSKAVSISPGPFFCSIVKPRLVLSTIWFILFAVPGSLLAVYLLYRMWRSRQKMLALKTSTQMTLGYLARYTLSTTVYVFLSLATFIPLLGIKDREYFPLDPEMVATTVRKSPWFEKSLCTTIPSEKGELYYFNLLCPGPVSFLPAGIGIAIFLMYGFGTHARLAYKHFWDKLFHRTKRRNSTVPLIGSGVGVSASQQQTFHHLSRLACIPEVIDSGSDPPERDENLLVTVHGKN